MYEMVWVCLGEPSQEIPAFPEWGLSDFRKVFFGPYHIHSSAQRVMENFFDPSHFAFVHEGTLGTQCCPELQDYKAHLTQDSLVLEDIKVPQPNTDSLGTNGEVEFNHKLSQPLALYTVKETCRGLQTFLFVATPIEEIECIAWGWAAINYGDASLDVKMREFQGHLFREDIAIVEAQEPARLPLMTGFNKNNEIVREIHTMCDLGSIMYRKWLQRRGVKFGVCRV
jgi:phenylpropionate dioxygenase-like ring-hydroxylating dioxygenase large terminal subunit